MTQQEFVDKYMPYAQQIEAEFKVPALVSLAQSALETGFGAHAPGNMMFGMKIGKSWTGKKQLLKTTEYFSTDDQASRFPEVLSITWEPERNKYKYIVKDYFRAYNSPLDSFRDYANQLRINYKFKVAFNYSDPYEFAVALGNSGYSTSSKYAETLTKYMNIIKKKQRL